MRLGAHLGPCGDPLNPVHNRDDETHEQAAYRLSNEVRRLRRGTDLLAAWQSVHALLPAELRAQCDTLNAETLAFLAANP